jgi:hypothetical protein
MKNIQALLIILFFSFLSVQGQSKMNTVGVSKPADSQDSFSVSIVVNTRHYILTQDSISVIYDCNIPLCNPKKLYRSKLKKKRSANFYNLLLSLHLDTLKEFYSYPYRCDYCQSSSILTVSLNKLPGKTISQYNGTLPSFDILLLEADKLIRKKKYRLFRK